MRWLTVLAIVAVLAPAADARRLPRHRPADFAVAYSDLEPFAAEPDHGTIAAQGEIERAGGHSGTFTLDDHELDALYAALRKAGVDRIRMRNDQMPNGTGVTIVITAGGHTWNLSTLGSTRIVDGDRARFDRAVALVVAVFDAKVP